MDIIKKQNNNNLELKKCEPVADLTFCLFSISHAAINAGARSRFPINCGSIANPFGCGNPKLALVQPRHMSDTSRPTPITSITHCAMHHTHAATLSKPLPHLACQDAKVNNSMKMRA